MLSRFALALSTLLLAATAAAAEVAEPARPAAEIAERIDDYRFLPRAPGTYRALAGMGDPRARGDGEADDFRFSQEAAALQRRLLPAQGSADDGFYPGET